MIVIKMEANVRNYLYRTMEIKEIEIIKDKPKDYERQLELIRVAKDRLMGKEPKISLSKESSIMSFMMGDD